jgi:hypothetical protein
MHVASSMDGAPWGGKVARTGPSGASSKTDREARNRVPAPDQKQTALNEREKEKDGSAKRNGRWLPGRF